MKQLWLEPAIRGRYILAALQQLLDLTMVTLAAIHPEVGGDSPDRRPLDLPSILADQLIQLSGYLADTASRYRDAAFAALHAPTRSLSERARSCCLLQAA